MAEFDLEQACKAKAKEVFEAMLKIALHGENESARLHALTFILERGYGKAVERHEHRYGVLEDEMIADAPEMVRLAKERRRQLELLQGGKPLDKEIKGPGRRVGRSPLVRLPLGGSGSLRNISRTSMRHKPPSERVIASVSLQWRAVVC